VDHASRRRQRPSPAVGRASSDAGKTKATLAGYLRMGGELSVLGIISISLEFMLSFSYDSDGKASGRATLTVEVKVLFFSKSVAISVEKRSVTLVDFAGAGDWTGAKPFRRLESGDRAQRRCLTAARRAEKTEELAVRDREGRPANRDEIAERLLQIVDPDLRHGARLNPEIC
jgi:hypothetical protein